MARLLKRNTVIFFSLGIFSQTPKTWKHFHMTCHEVEEVVSFSLNFDLKKGIHTLKDIRIEKRYSVDFFFSFYLFIFWGYQGWQFEIIFLVYRQAHNKWCNSTWFCTFNRIQLNLYDLGRAALKQAQLHTYSVARGSKRDQFTQRKLQQVPYEYDKEIGENKKTCKCGREADFWYNSLFWIQYKSSLAQGWPPVTKFKRYRGNKGNIIFNRWAVRPAGILICSIW